MLVLGSLFHVKQRPQDHSLRSRLPVPVGRRIASAESSFSLPADHRSSGGDAPQVLDYVTRYALTAPVGWRYSGGGRGTRPGAGVLTPNRAGTQDGCAQGHRAASTLSLLLSGQGCEAPQVGTPNRRVPCFCCQAMVTTSLPRTWPSRRVVYALRTDSTSNG